MTVPRKLDVWKGGMLLARRLNVATTAWNSWHRNESGLLFSGKKVFLLKTSAKRFIFPLIWLDLKGMRFCSRQMSRKPDSPEGATLQLLWWLQIWICFTKLIETSLLRILWTSKEPAYSSQPTSVCKNSIFSVTFHNPSELHLTAAKSSPEHTEAGRGKFSWKKYDHICHCLWDCPVMENVTMLKDGRSLRSHERNAKKLKRWCLC